MVHPVARAAGALTLAGVAGLAWASLVEVRWYALREVTRAGAAGRAAAPLRVLHLSDLHLVPSQRSKIDWVRDLASLAPDLVVDTGDNLAHTEALPAAAACARAAARARRAPSSWARTTTSRPGPKNPARYLLRGPAPARRRRLRRGCPAGELAARLREAGWKDLTNRRDVVHAAGRTLSLVGVDDPHLDRDVFPRRRAPTAAPRTCTSAVTHAPYRRVLDAMQADGADLVLAGHTHGGQLACRSTAPW